MFSDIARDVRVNADKGYKANRVFLHSKKLSDGMVRKTYRGRLLTEENKGRNKQLSETSYGGTVFRNAARYIPIQPRFLFRIAESHSAKSFESNLCQPAKGCQQASCACCCLKGGNAL
ncbi:hypothetical protein C7N83_04640 [Neisseria iguanae]|uniref:Uncharacterized protein n=1 Tax=Neisseria iguanae TaxID=90242 RepID=A0A2P7U176_9NEIS|nr:hypothetical protein C7N83_04640 [Neisseria iguanae]